MPPRPALSRRAVPRRWRACHGRRRRHPGVRGAAPPLRAERKARMSKVLSNCSGAAGSKARHRGWTANQAVDPRSTDGMLRRQEHPTARALLSHTAFVLDSMTTAASYHARNALGCVTTPSVRRRFSIYGATSGAKRGATVSCLYSQHRLLIRASPKSYLDGQDGVAQLR